MCAPLTWQPGDARRPYPTGNINKFDIYNTKYLIWILWFVFILDIEMRMGVLGRLNDLPLNGHMMQPQGLADMVRSNNQIGILIEIICWKIYLVPYQYRI